MFHKCTKVHSNCEPFLIAFWLCNFLYYLVRVILKSTLNPLLNTSILTCNCKCLSNIIHTTITIVLTTCCWGCATSLSQLHIWVKPTFSVFFRNGRRFYNACVNTSIWNDNSECKPSYSILMLSGCLVVFERCCDTGYCCPSSDQSFTFLTNFEFVMNSNTIMSCYQIHS